MIELEESVQLCTKPQMYEYLVKVAKTPKKFVLTDTLLETNPPQLHHLQNNEKSDNNLHPAMLLFQKETEAEPLMASYVFFHVQDFSVHIHFKFLVMAATLIDIKCKMLLPKEVNEEGEEEDPRAELVQKLLEYKMYKYMSLELKDRQVDAERTLYREQVFRIHLPDIVQILLRNFRNRDIVNINFIFFNQMEQQVQRTFKRLQFHRNCHIFTSNAAYRPLFP